MQRRAILLACLAALLSACVTTPAPNTTIYLVRHAEKEAGENPSLTPAGEARAAALVKRLGDKPITRVFSTDTRRTRQTAAPFADTLGINVEIYDGKALPAFATQLRATPGTILVVGHSNTTPELVTLLGGEAGEPIIEASEFDRLYELHVSGNRVETTVSRYGP